jgi:hypothetical protein
MTERDNYNTINPTAQAYNCVLIVHTHNHPLKDSLVFTPDSRVMMYLDDWTELMVEIDKTSGELL